MPSDRGNAAPALPRWIREPAASDFASPERLAFEATSGDDGSGLACCSNPQHRFRHALDLLYGQDQEPPGAGSWPRWPGRWAPDRVYDPAAYEVLPDGPPEWLRAAVEEHQAEEDERTRRVVAKNSFPEYQAAMLVRIGVPPALSLPGVPHPGGAATSGDS